LIKKKSLYTFATKLSQHTFVEIPRY